MDFYSGIIREIISNQLTKDEITKLKNKFCSKYKLKKIPTDIEILLHASSQDLPKLKNLQTKPTRTISGVAVCAIMTKPFPCKHGKCSYCPGGMRSFYGTVPQSYTGHEPATMRAIRNKYDPYLQIFNRLEQYAVLGHNFEKIELIIMGGTFPSFPKKYQNCFITYSLKALNDFSNYFYNNNLIKYNLSKNSLNKDSFKKISLIKNTNPNYINSNYTNKKTNRTYFDIIKFREFFQLPGDIYNKSRTLNIQKKILEIKANPSLETSQTLATYKSNVQSISKSSFQPAIQLLEAQQKNNETSKIRCVAMCIETRPDYSKKRHINQMLSLGATRIELGIQSISDDILMKIKRGHTVKDSIIATQLLKDSLLKVGYHIMPGLPGSSKQKDIETIKELFINPSFQPDALKIYPCMVMPGTELSDEFNKGKFHPLSTKEAAEIIAESKKYLPEYARVMRVQRDIPTKVRSAGVDKTNLRQYVEDLMIEKNIKCRCIRCREPKAKTIQASMIKLIRRDYEASNGTEIFLSFEADDMVLGFLRLRIPYRPFRPEITQGSAGIRELHVYGPAAGLNHPGAIQHRGLGKKLLNLAEIISKNEFKKTKILVISGIGAREYYKKFGYKIDGPYMSKKI